MQSIVVEEPVVVDDSCVCVRVLVLAIQVFCFFHLLSDVLVEGLGVGNLVCCGRQGSVNVLSMSVCARVECHTVEPVYNGRPRKVAVLERRPAIYSTG